MRFPPCDKRLPSKRESSDVVGGSPVGRGAFTLIEILVAVAILAVLTVMLTSLLSMSVSTVGQAYKKIDQFATANAAFEGMVRTLSQATLGTFWSYDNDTNPTRYQRSSDLHFLVEAGQSGGQEVFFQAPLGSDGNLSRLQDPLNAVGYWVEFGNDEDWRPAHITTDRYRYRLFEAIQPSSDLAVYSTSGSGWTAALKTVPDPGYPIAENVIAAVVWPRMPEAGDPEGDDLTQNFLYDSRGGPSIQRAQLPPSLMLTLIVIDEKSAARIENGANEPVVIRNALEGRFENVSTYEADIEAVGEALEAAGIGYRILSRPVVLRESKWSQEP